MRRALPLYARRINPRGSVRNAWTASDAFVLNSRHETTGRLFATSQPPIPRWSNRRRKLSSSTRTELDMVQVTRIDKGSQDFSSPYQLEREELTVFVDDLLLRTRSLMDGDDSGSTNRDLSIKGRNAHHVIAFSGGIDSSVAAALIQKVASSPVPSLSSRVYDYETVTAVLGLSPAVPMDQRELAEEVASVIGVTLEQISTTEGTDEVYVANDGQACLACKTHLYDNLKTIAEKYCVDEPNELQSIIATAKEVDTILYNGTNADDLKDPTRLGLIAANDFSVRSPLSGLSKDRVRAVGRHLGLPNWDYAASPCLRSRLAVGVSATSDRLKNVGVAEAFVKNELGKEQSDGVWDVRRSLRVRILSKNRAMIEVDDDEILQSVESHLQSERWKTEFLENLGFAAVGVRRFKTGSVAPPPPPPNRIATIASPTGARKLRRRP